MDDSPMQFTVFSNKQDYLSYQAINAEHFAWRMDDEHALGEELLPYEGYCCL